MGMDVIGKHPRNKKGEYFRANVWSWRPIASYMEFVAPELMEGVKYLYSNDGDGLDGEAALALADILRERREDGTMRAFVDSWEASRKAIPPESCLYCNGTGVRTDEVGIAQHMVERQWCNGCEGKGKRESFQASYGVEYEHLSEFVDFIANCGGFQIW